MSGEKTSLVEQPMNSAKGSERAAHLQRHQVELLVRTFLSSFSALDESHAGIVFGGSKEVDAIIGGDLVLHRRLD
eukprot:CAMPEP_0196136320 /NCGR_PEP_ID=MMETSP0910-20130528/4662_1 /TAXON_ID=49265 /ORGANISM="Thalassiosira rotula, Strain GSO102" /LENGTH=74 /DNA_ID=CAMNT_0041396585 /DNA_START=579 /DNA_END=803 /DNA_ORIENTATION=+